MVVSPSILETPYHVLEEEMLGWAKNFRDPGTNKLKRRPGHTESRRAPEPDTDSTGLDEPGISTRRKWIPKPE